MAKPGRNNGEIKGSGSSQLKKIAKSFASVAIFYNDSRLQAQGVGIFGFFLLVRAWEGSIWRGVLFGGVWSIRNHGLPGRILLYTKTKCDSTVEFVPTTLLSMIKADGIYITT